MGLVFPRVAHNFIKNGYFPTDEQTLEGILACLDTTGGIVRVVDPCCGCGTALAFVRDHLISTGASVEALGVEFDQERAWHAKSVLDRVIHSDVNDVHCTSRSVGLLFLNPPYGQALRDDAGTGDRRKSDRLEKMFYRKTVPWLAPGGILVLIVPFAVIDEEFAQLIAKQFSDVTIRMAPERQFRQVVVFGRRKRSDSPSMETAKRLMAVGQSGYDGCETLDALAPVGIYDVPATHAEKFGFTALRLDAPQLAQELLRLRSQSLWPTFAAFHGSSSTSVRPPLRQLSDWHLALALAAGQIGGVIRSGDGRRLLIKGDTLKEKIKKTESAVNEKDGSVVAVTTMTDRFVPTIRAIDLTPDGRDYGQIFTIR